MCGCMWLNFVRPWIIELYIRYGVDFLYEIHDEYLASHILSETYVAKLRIIPKSAEIDCPSG